MQQRTCAVLKGAVTGCAAKNDTDADGSVTFDEFWKWANKEEEPRSHDSSDVYSRVRARFNEHDDANDGLLHMSEFVSFFEGLKMA